MEVDESQEIMNYCSVHAGRKLELYCMGCKVLICIKCKEHYRHGCELANRVKVKKPKREILSLLEPVKQKLAYFGRALKQNWKCYEDVTNQRASTKVYIQQLSEEKKEVTAETGVHSNLQVIESRKSELLDQLEQLTQDKLKSIDAQRVILETVRTQLTRSLECMEERINASSEENLLKVNTYIVKQVKNLTSMFEPKILKLNVEADIMFVASAVPQMVCAPSSVSTTLISNHLAKVGKEFIAKFHSIGKPLGELLEALKCTLVSNITGITLQGTIESLGRDQYQISYQPTIKGRHQLHIKIEDQDIRGSPFSVAVKAADRAAFSQLSSIPTEFRPSVGVAVNNNGEVVLADLQRVFVFSFKGGRLRLLYYAYAVDFNSGVAVDDENNIIVTQGSLGIKMYTPELDKILHSVGIGLLGIKRPTGIAFNSLNHKIYVLDEDCLLILNSDFTYYSTFGKKGIICEIGELNHPQGIACDSNGNVYIVNSGNYGIQVFTAEGKFVRYFVDKRQLHYPMGIAIDTNDKVYVTGDTINSHVSVYTEGQFVTSFWAGEGTSAIAVDNCGVVYVCSPYNDCIRVF